MFPGIIKTLGRLKDDLNVSRYYIYRFISVWKILLFLVCIVCSVWMDGDDPAMFFQLFSAGFGPHNIVVEEVRKKIFTHRLYFYLTNMTVFNILIYLIFPGSSHARWHGRSGPSECYFNRRFRRSGSGIQICLLRHAHTNICGIFLLCLREICLQDSHTRLQLRFPC